MKRNEYHVYGCTFPRTTKEYHYVSQFKFEIGDIALVEVRDFRSGEKSLKEVTIKSYVGVKELSKQEMSYYKRILGANLE